jgi:hypothetical protein
LYLPAITIIAVVLFLHLLIGVSTYRNLDHEKEVRIRSLRADHKGKDKNSLFESGLKG